MSRLTQALVRRLLGRSAKSRGSNRRRTFRQWGAEMLEDRCLLAGILSVVPSSATPGTANLAATVNLDPSASIGTNPSNFVISGNVTEVGTPTYTVVDTGQTKHYNNTSEISAPTAGQAFYGQDAQFVGNQPSYTVSGDGLTVYDNNTRLTWMQSPDTNFDGSLTYEDKLTYQNAVLFPAVLNAAAYGGSTDWRLPTVKELYSLINHSGVDLNPQASTGTTPFIDTDVFGFAYGFIGESGGTGPGGTTMIERIIDSQWATSTLYVANTDEMFGVNFADGRIKNYSVATGTGKPYHVLCVRGNTSYGVNDFADNGDGTITDDATGLMWSQADSGAGLNWEQALAWVQEKNTENHLGHNDWRLPDAKELQSIVDYSRSPDTTASAAIDPLFTSTEITNEKGQADYGFYWTSTTHVSESPEGTVAGKDAAYVAFGRAMGYVNNTWVDIHGAGCQRSDPKEGDPGDYPFGHGPQGDAIRIFNYVRLVRDASGIAPALSLSVATDSVSEAAGSAATTVTISRNTDAASALTVNLASSDTTEATVPATATIPAGQSSVTVNLAAVDDAIVDGTQMVTITASATGFANGSDTLQVTDNDAAALSIAVGAWLVPAGQTAWRIPISVTGGARVDGINFNIQVESGSKPAAEVAPVFVALDILNGTIFDGKNTGSWDNTITDWIAWDWTDTDPAEVVYADGIVGYVTVNTVNCPNGTWDLVMSDTLNGPTDFAGMEAVVVDGTITVTDTNQAPQLTEPILDQTAPANGRFRFALAPQTFVDPDASQTLTYAAVQADGSPLPNWLALGAQTGVFSGRPLVRDAGQFAVRITASDSGSPSLSAWAEFSITVTPHPFPFQNADMSQDVDGDEVVEPQDALIVINWLNAHGSGPVPDSWPEAADDSLFFFDVYGDNLITPLDVLAVINFLNGRSSSAPQAAEGEGLRAATASQITPARQTGITWLPPLRDAAVDLSFRRAADLSSPADWDELLGVLARR